MRRWRGCDRAGAALTVQKQLGLFHKRRCVQETGGETRASWGPPLGRPARNKDTLSRGVLSHQGGCKINTSVLRCSPQGREIIISRPVWPPSTWHSPVSPHASPDHPSFVSKEEGNYPSLFVYSQSRYQEPQGAHSRTARGWGWGLQACLSFTERRDLGLYLSQNLPFTNKEVDPKRGDHPLKMAQ